LGQTVLAKACIAAQIDFNNNEAHSALYDTEKTAELFCFIVNKWRDLGGWPLVIQDTVNVDKNSTEPDNISN
jgi:ribonuclease T